MLPRGVERAKGVSHFPNSLPRPRKMGPESASLLLSPKEGDQEGGVHSSKVGSLEQPQQWGGGPGSQIEDQGKQGAIFPRGVKEEGRRPCNSSRW